MFIKNHKKAIIGLVIVAAMSFGGATAFAATTGLTLTPVKGVHLDIANAKMGTATVVKGVTPKLPDGPKFTAPSDSFTSDGTVKTLNANVTLVNGKIVGDFTGTTAVGK